MTEAQFTKKLCHELEQCGAIVIPYVASRRQPAGFPDRYVIHRWWSGWLEFKSPKEKLRTIQRIRINEMNGRVPGIAWVVRMPNMIEDALGVCVAHFEGASSLLLTLEELSNGATRSS